MIVEDVTEVLLASNEVERGKLYYQLNSLESALFLPIQADILPMQCISQLEYLCTANIRVQPSQTCNTPSFASLLVNWRRSGGGIQSETLSYTIASGLAKDFKPTTPHAKAQTATPNEVLPASSFNLGMTQEQRNVKDSLVLPYTRLSLDEPAKPILAPDFDDEDPDDDLDI